MTVVEIINLISSLASLILAVIAIWLSLHFYDKSKDSEKQTEVNVNGIKTQTAALTDISTRMLDKYTDYVTKPKQADESFLIITQLLGQFTSANVGGFPRSGGTAQLEQYGADLTMAALFYAGLTNLALQDLLPNLRRDIEPENSLPALLDGSKEDYETLTSTLSNLDASLVNASSLHNLYEIAMGWRGARQIKNMDELYIVPTDDQPTE